ncbi:hypothetical protein HMPREF0201_04837 [Cedecea davisae DSM 4568]|uniref:Uncharacterized protein n=1 Tax=Cedecea davisae DSM 4568 TaxID=566551 RepID=S3IIP0_9ENTR|nr:hypothetical protein HMPREF0201_04837 [Cedecea davisae DSM 4568]
MGDLSRFNDNAGEQMVDSEKQKGQLKSWPFLRWSAREDYSPAGRC